MRVVAFVCTIYILPLDLCNSWMVAVTKIHPLHLFCSHCVHSFHLTPYYIRDATSNSHSQLKNPSNYGFYKERCGRTRRLKAVWGDDEYKCYHDVDTTCFNMTVANEEGDVVIAETNIKDAPPEKVGVMPRWAAIVLGVAAFVILLPCFVCMYKRYCKRSKKDVV